MTELEAEPGSQGIRCELAAALLTATVIAVAVTLLYGPAVSLTLTGDSYQWIQHAHAAVHQPTLLFADPDVTSDVAAEAERVRAEQLHLRVVRVVPLG